MSAAKPITNHDLHASESDRETGLFGVDWKRIGLFAGIAGVIFLLGLVPMWLRARTVASQRDAARHELQIFQLQNTLSSATIAARRGDYEPARQMASDFYAELRAQIDVDNNSDSATLTPAQRDRVRPLLAHRDEIITLLARSDPAAAERLSDLYVSYRQAMNGSQL